MLLARAIAAFLLMPGLVAFAVPLLLFEPPPRAVWQIEGWVPLIVGVVVLLHTVWEFYAAGRGTLAPWSPPITLVTSGLYRWSRNPMYIGVLLILAGWALGFRSVSIAIYAVAVAVAFHLRVVFYEEPIALSRFGDRWIAYRNSAPRWLIK